MATIETILEDSPEKMPHQDSGYSITISQVGDKETLSE